VTEERIFRWKNAYGGTSNILFEQTGFRQIVADTKGRNLYSNDPLHISNEIKLLLKWMNTAHPIDPVLKAGVSLSKVQ
jgi:hypothetical protein